jgi:hypothetical protein
VPAECYAAFLHFSFAAFALGLERTLFVLPGVLVRRVIDFGRTVRLDDLMLYSFPVCDLASAFGVSV